MAGIDQLDADRARVDVAMAAPERDAGVPGAAILRHQAEDAAVLLDHVVRADLRRRVAHPRQRRVAGLHAGVVQHQHVDGRVAARVVVGGRAVDHGAHFSIVGSEDVPSASDMLSVRRPPGGIDDSPCPFLLHRAAGCNALRRGGADARPAGRAARRACASRSIWCRSRRTSASPAHARHRLPPARRRSVPAGDHQPRLAALAGRTAPTSYRGSEWPAPGSSSAASRWRCRRGAATARPAASSPKISAAAKSPDYHGAGLTTSQDIRSTYLYMRDPALRRSQPHRAGRAIGGRLGRAGERRPEPARGRRRS